MHHMYMLSLVDEEDVTSVLFKSKQNAITHIARSHSSYVKVAEDRSQDIEYWRKSNGEGLILERLKVED